MASSGELIDKYDNKQQPEVQTTESLAKASRPKEGDIYYTRNDFKRFMGYEEPDYLRVAGFYASAEANSKSWPYNRFLVKKADYIARRFKWYTDDGEVDVKRAENAIRNACRTKAPNGLFYMYTVTNKNKRLTDKGGSSVYMSGRRYSQLLDEIAGRAVAYAKITDNNNQNEIVDDSESCVESDLEKTKKMVRKLATMYKFSGYTEGAVVWVAKHLLEKLSVEGIRMYFNQITSDLYCRQASFNPGCPQINDIFDVFHKYDKIQNFMYDRKRHILTPC